MGTERETNEASPEHGQPRSGDGAEREAAIEQIKRKRRFQRHAVTYGAIAIFLTVVWAITEYNNAGGFPTSGFSQSSSIPNTWNIWIIYPLLIISLIAGVDAWNTFGRKPISESDIQRELDRARDGR